MSLPLTLERAVSVPTRPLTRDELHALALRIIPGPGELRRRERAKEEAEMEREVDGLAREWTGLSRLHERLPGQLYVRAEVQAEQLAAQAEALAWFASEKVWYGGPGGAGCEAFWHGRERARKALAGADK